MFENIDYDAFIFCRASHPESLAWCRVMASAGLPVTVTLYSLKAEKRQMFEAAARKQTQVQEDNDKGTVLRDLYHFTKATTTFAYINTTYCIYNNRLLLPFSNRN
jgi:hypothetical protein